MLCTTVSFRNFACGHSQLSPDFQRAPKLKMHGSSVLKYPRSCHSLACSAASRWHSSSGHLCAQEDLAAEGPGMRH